MKQNILQRIWRFYYRHAERLVLPFQPIVENPQILQNLQNRHYFRYYFTSFILAFSLLLSTWYQYKTYGYDSGVFFNHRILSPMPKFFREQGNVAFLSVITLIGLINGFLVLDPCPHLRFVYVYHLNNRHGRRLESSTGFNTDRILENRLLRFYRTYSQFLKRFVLCLTLQLNIGIRIPFVVYEFWNGIPDSLTILYILICPYYFALQTSSSQVAVQFVIQNSVIQIKQRRLISWIRWCSRKCSRRSFLKSLCEVFEFCREVQASSAFYSKYVSAMICMFMFAGCSLLNAMVQKATDATPWNMLLWGSFAGVFLFSIFLLNASASRTIFWNGQLFAELRQLQIRILAKSNGNRKGTIKLDLVNEYSALLKKSNFRLANSALISNRLFFFHIFGYVSVVYMKILSETPVQ